MICSRDGCAGTANYRVGTSGSHLHIMWSSPNNFDKHASHLAVGTDTLSVETLHVYVLMIYKISFMYMRG